MGLFEFFKKKDKEKKFEVSQKDLKKSFNNNPKTIKKEVKVISNDKKVKNAEHIEIELSPKKLLTLFTIIYRDINELYKQFKWTYNPKQNKTGCACTIQTLIKDGYGVEHNLEINIYEIRTDKGRFNTPTYLIGCLIFYYPKVNSGAISARANQNFPIENDVTPKGIARIARIISNWIKNELKKIE